MGRRLGDPADPLLVSVRSGAKYSMPGMMETVLNIGLNDESVHGPGRAERRRAVRDGLLPAAAADVRLHGARHRGRGVRPRARRAEGAPRHHRGHRPRGRRPARAGGVVQEGSSRSTPAAPFPQDPREQMDLAVRAVFDSWNTERAVLYRRQEQIPEDLGTAVNIQAMVFGNRGDDVGLRRLLHPRPGVRQRRASTATTCRTRRARTSSPASATRSRWRTSARSTRRSHDELLAIMSTLEQHYRDMCDIEFTDRARQALDAADPGRQADPRGGVPDRRAHGRRGADRPRRGAAPGHRRPARPADVPALRREGRPRR